MKNSKWFILMLAAAVTIAAACSRGYESEKNGGGLNIKLKADAYPLVMGDNSLTAKITDASGKPVTDAEIDIRFYMPPMPGMAPMDYSFQPQPKGNAYPFTVNVAMGGGWKIDLAATRPGKAPVTTTFNLDAR